MLAESIQAGNLSNRLDDEEQQKHSDDEDAKDNDKTPVGKSKTHKPKLFEEAIFSKKLSESDEKKKHQI